jgi:hypothetical protein
MSRIRNLNADFADLAVDPRFLVIRVIRVSNFTSVIRVIRVPEFDRRDPRS